ncbi:MAG TPA: NAD(P) transhydrogenase subunit alpha [Saprospiraceae bacterium]|nr:NAD(P) transhydrogenase subunit alpha [Saprospiraceae bacterium]
MVYSEKDTRCPLTSVTLKKFGQMGLTVLAQVEAIKLFHKDLANEDGIEFAERQEILAKADILYSNTPLTHKDLAHLNEQAILISFYAPFSPDSSTEQIQNLPNHIFSMDMIPRSTIAQSMDALSSMASISGYKAVLLAAERLPRYFPMMMTAAGTIKPAKVLILGAGVAGLQAIATARRLGAKVSAFDVRTAVKEEVESLGAKFIEVDGSREDNSSGGYAVEQTDEYKLRQKEVISRHVKESDVVIATAQVRGRKAPTLITQNMVEQMPPGSVIVDLAASTGGNCELTEDEKEIEHKGILIIGNSELYKKALWDASTLLANNIYHFVGTLVSDKGLHIDPDNDIVSASLIHPEKNN